MVYKEWLVPHLPGRAGPGAAADQILSFRVNRLTPGDFAGDVVFDQQSSAPEPVAEWRGTLSRYIR